MAPRKSGMKMKRGKKSVTRKSFAKRAVSKAKTASLVKLIKSVSLKQTETKDTHVISENQQLYHNTPFGAVTGLLYLEQGINDNETGTTQYSKRIGDEVIGRGISLKFWFANKGDRPDVTYKLVIYRYKSGTTPTYNLDPFMSQGTSNFLIRDMNTDKFKIMRVINFRISTSAQRITAQDTFQAAEGHKAMTIWIPLKRKIKYEDSSSTPKDFDYGFTIVAYDSYGTLTTDNIASFAVNRKFYFKDP